MTSTAEVIAFVNDRYALSYSVVRALAGGMQSGAFEVADGNQRAVLKWSADPAWAVRVERAAVLVARLRAAGYPTPAWLCAGTLPSGLPYQLQSFAAGSVLDLDCLDAAELVDIVSRQRDLAPDREYNWSDYLRRVVFEGWDDTWSTVRGLGDEAACLISRFDALCRPFRDSALPTGDLVHGDLNPGNILTAGGRVTAIIDIEAVSGGSRAYDLTTLASYAIRHGAPETVQTDLLEAALKAGGQATVTLSVATGFADLARFVHHRNPAHLPSLYSGTTHLLDLLGN